MSLPFLGHGVGLRVPHYARALTDGLDVDWVEAISENFFGGGGRPWAVLEKLRREMPIVFHGVSMGVGSEPAPARLGVGPQPSDHTAPQPLLRYLSRLHSLVSAFEPAWVSDHLCWTHWAGCYSHDLLPLPYTEEALQQVVDNVQFAQDYLKRPLMLENVSSYVAFSSSRLSEWEFLSEISRRSGCYLLLDLNNIVVSSTNHAFEPRDYLEGVRASHVAQLHLANHSRHDGYRFDDHRGPVCDEVWQLYREALALLGSVSSLVEWDEDVPDWELLRAEQRKASRHAEEVLGEQDAARGVREVGRASPQERSRRGEAVGAGPCLSSEQSPDATPGKGGGAGVETKAPPEPSKLVSFAEAQSLMFRAIAAPSGVADFLEREGETGRVRFDSTFVGSAELSHVARVDIYANAYFYRLLDVLADLFPRVRYACGATAFHNLVTDYVWTHPSRDPDLRHLGRALGDFVANHSLGRAYPGLSELVRFEEALNQALDGPARPPLTASDLQAISPSDWGALRFELAPPAQLLPVAWDLCAVDAAWRGQQPEECQRLLATPSPGWVVVARQGFLPYARAAGGLEAVALPLCAEGVTFGEMCERAVEWLGGDTPAPLVQLLHEWLHSGLLQWRA